jgi:hypothetical protein
MLNYLPADKLENNPEYLPVVLKPDGEGGHRLAKVTHFTMKPVGDGWDEVFYYRYIGSHTDIESRKNGLGGYVYVLVNHQYPNMCKIGMTTNHPTKRLQQINNAGVVVDWEIAYTFKCARPYDFEQAIHQKLEDIRSRKDREFFDIELKDAIALIEEMSPVFGPI